MIDCVPTLLRGDVDGHVLERARNAGQVAWDIETSGLDWRRGEIRTSQLAFGDEVVIVQLGHWGAPDNLRALLEDGQVLKVFHHAPFDLRFMAQHWKADPANVACTKIASKILDPTLAPKSHSLKPVLARYLDVHIDKSEQRSDWSKRTLSRDQLAYAAGDVEHLLRLYARMLVRAEHLGVAHLLMASYLYLPTRVRLDLMGAPDVYDY